MLYTELTGFHALSFLFPHLLPFFLSKSNPPISSEEQLIGDKTLEDLYSQNFHLYSRLNDIWLHKEVHSYTLRVQNLWIFILTFVSSSLVLNWFLFLIFGYDLVFSPKTITFLLSDVQKNHRNGFWCEERVIYKILVSSFPGNFLILSLS